MIVTNATLADSVASLRAIAALRLPVKTSFKVSRALRRIEEALRDHDAAYAALAARHVAKGEGGKPVAGPNPGEFLVADADAFRRDVAELRAIEVALDIGPLELAELDTAEAIEPRHLMLLDWLVKD